VAHGRGKCGENAVHRQQKEMRKCNNIYEKHSVCPGKEADMMGKWEASAKEN